MSKLADIILGVLTLGVSTLLKRKKTKTVCKTSKNGLRKVIKTVETNSTVNFDNHKVPEEGDK